MQRACTVQERGFRLTVPVLSCSFYADLICRILCSMLNTFCPTSTNALVELDSIHWFTEAAFVCHIACPTSPQRDSKFQVHLSQRDGFLSAHDEPPRIVHT